MLRLLLPFLLLLPLHALTKPDCVDLICQSKDGHRLGLLEGTRHRQELIDLEGKTIDRCRSCEDCTSSGYSVCIQPRHFEVHRRLFHTGRSCECAHSGPTVSILPPTPPPQQPAAAQNGTAMCRLMPRDGSRPGQQVREVPELKTGEMFFQLCYASALRKLPMPRASNEKEEEEGAAEAAAATPPGSGHHVLVTVEQFWLADYWQALRPKQLQLFYVFPVKDRDHCEGLVMAPSVQDLMWINAAKTREQINKAAMSWLCRANLGIAMNGLEQAAAEERRAAESGEPRGIEDAEEYYDNADPDLPPEVQFERDVFAGADRVRFYYELIVHRENQLKAGPGGKVKFEPRDTLIKSESLDFELHPEIYGTGMARSRSQGHVTGPEVRKVNIEKHKDKMDLTRENSPRDPIVLPAGGRSRSGGRSGEGQRTSPTSSSSATRPIQSRPAASSAHAMDGPSTAVPAPSSTERELESPDDFTDSMAGEQSPTGGGTSSKSPSSQPSGGDEPAAEDWLMLRNVMIVFLLLLALFFLVVLCYKRHLCCFTKRASSSGSSANGGAQQRNGKPVIRVQNGKEYREPGK